jgi:phosphate:Na+ symporter
MLAGLGLFFVGISTLTGNLRQLTGRRFRMMLERSTRFPFLSALAGALLGATMQTGSAITFILVGMVGAGMITVERSLPVRLGAAVGTSTMVFVATMDIQVLILFLIGIAGISLAQSRSPHPLIGIVFGIGLMFFGLRLVGSSASSLTELAWFHSAIAGVNGQPLTAFALGAVLSIVVQSPQSVAILAIAMTSADVLSTWTTIAIIYGSNFGGGISTYLLSAGFRGTSRQIMLFQVMFNLLTGFVLMALFFIERLVGVPLMHATVTALASNVESQMAFVYLGFNVFGATMMFTIRKPILAWIEQRWPPVPEESLAKLEFLHDRAFDTPDLALDLAEREEKRFFRLLSGYLDSLRLATGEDAKQAQMITGALNQLHESIEEALTELGHKGLGIEGSEQLILLANRNRLLGTLHSSLTDLAAAVRAAKTSPHLEKLAGIVIEAIDALMGTAIDAFDSNDPEDLSNVWEATQDRSEKMRAIRRRFMQSGETLSNDERLDLMALTNGLERTIWVLHEFVGELTESKGDDTIS